MQWSANRRWQTKVTGFRVQYNIATQEHLLTFIIHCLRTSEHLLQETNLPNLTPSVLDLLLQGITHCPIHSLVDLSVRKDRLHAKSNSIYPNPAIPGVLAPALYYYLTAHVIKLLHSRCGKFPSSNFLLCLRSSVLSDSQALHIWLERAVG